MMAKRNEKRPILRDLSGKLRHEKFPVETPADYLDHGQWHRMTTPAGLEIEFVEIQDSRLSALIDDSIEVAKKGHLDG